MCGGIDSVIMKNPAIVVATSLDLYNNQVSGYTKLTITFPVSVHNLIK